MMLVYDSTGIKFSTTHRPINTVHFLNTAAQQKSIHTHPNILNDSYCSRSKVPPVHVIYLNDVVTYNDVSLTI